MGRFELRSCGFPARITKTSGLESIFHRGGVSNVDGSIERTRRQEKSNHSIKHWEGIRISEFNFRNQIVIPAANDSAAGISLGDGLALVDKHVGSVGVSSIDIVG